MVLREVAMARAVALTLDRTDAEVLERSLLHREERLCDIKREICPPENVDPYEQEQCAYFTQEDEVIGRILNALRRALEAPAEE